MSKTPRGERVAIESLEERRMLSAAALAAASSRVGSFDPIVLDLNGDRALDVVVAQNIGENTTAATKVTIWKHHNIQGLDAPERVAPVLETSLVLPHALEFQAADVNRDGFPDLVATSREAGSGIATGRRQYRVLLNDGTGDFKTVSAKVITDRETGRLVATGDVDGDGRADLLVENAAGRGRYHIAISRGDGTFSLQRSFVLPHVLDVRGLVDLNGDGRRDLAYFERGDKPTEPQLNVALGNGKGGFAASAQRAYTGRGILDARIGDFDRDGRLDLAVVTAREAGSGMATGRMAILSLNRKGALAERASGDLPDTFPANRIVATGDLDGDGAADLAGEVDGGTWRAELAAPHVKGNDITFTGASIAIDEPGVHVAGLAAGDLDGDGVPELVGLGPTSDGSADVVYVRSNPFPFTKNRLSPLFQTQDRRAGTGCSAGSAMLVGNFDDDRASEVLTVENAGDTTTGPTILSLLDRSDAGGTSRRTLVVSHVFEVRLGDFDGDGTADILLKRILAGGRTGFAVILNDGRGGFDESAARYATDPYVETVNRIADVDGDGRADMIVHRDLAARGTLYRAMLSNGDGTFSPAKAFILPHVLETKAASDLNGDGNADLVLGVRSPRDAASGQATGQIILLGDGAGGFTRGDVLRSDSFVRQVLVADFNGDARPDVAMVSDGHGGGGSGGSVMLAVALSNGKGGFVLAPPTKLAAAAGARVTAGDLNGDGLADCIAIDEAGVHVAVNQQDGGFNSISIDEPGVHFCDIAVGDVDGDGLMDVTGWGDGAVFVARNTGKPGGDFTASPFKRIEGVW